MDNGPLLSSPISSPSETSKVEPGLFKLMEFFIQSGKE
jgi:hypothetical protein